MNEKADEPTDGRCQEHAIEVTRQAAAPRSARAFYLYRVMLPGCVRGERRTGKRDILRRRLGMECS